MTLDTELDSLLSSAADTHHVDFVEVPVYDQDTAEIKGVKRIRCRGATLFELARFFLRFPEIFKLMTDQMDLDADDKQDSEAAQARAKKSMQAMLELIMRVPDAIAAFNSCFVGRPFNKATEEGLAQLSNDANLPILERGLFKTFEGDVAGFFKKKGGGLMKAMGIKMAMTTTPTSSPSSKTKTAALES